MADCIPIEKCREGFLYSLMAQNIGLGVYDGKGTFVGIRSKWDREFLDSEDHVDSGGSFCTAIPTEEICQMPEDLEPVDYLPGTVDSFSKREMVFDRPRKDGGKGWVFKDTGEPPSEGQMYCPTMIHNDALFDWLEEIEAKLNAPEQTDEPRPRDEETAD